MNAPPRRPRPPQRAPNPQPVWRDPRLILGGAGGGIVLLLLLTLLFVGPCSILNPSGNKDEASFNCPRIKKVPELPGGFEAGSEFKDFSDGKCNKTVPSGPASISIPLDAGKAGPGLGFYTYAGDKWQRLGGAELTEDGKSARVTVDKVPENGVILRRSPGAFQIMGVLPQGQALRPQAEQIATIVGGLDFAPAADGAVNGNVANIKRGDAALLVPVVRASGGAEADAVNALLPAADRRAAHAANLAKLVQSNRLDGIELEYSAVNDAARRSDFTDLVRQSADAVHKAGGLLLLTLPLPSHQGNSWNSGAYDWKELGKLADYIKIAPERDQSVYRKNVPDALTYLSGQMDAKKLVLTLSPLAAEKSTEGIRTLSTVEALSLASQFTVRDRERAAANSDVTITADNLTAEGGAASGLNWDGIAATVSFTYRAGDQPRTVWIENVFSAGFKSEYAKLWGLGGIAIDDASNSDALADIWPAAPPLLQNAPLSLQQPNSQLLRPEWQVDSRPFKVGDTTITWKTPPDPGNHTITLIVGDGVMRVANTSRVSLRAAAPGSPSGTPAPSPRPGTSPTPAPRASATPTPVRTTTPSR